MQRVKWSNVYTDRDWNHSSSFEDECGLSGSVTLLAREASETTGLGQGMTHLSEGWKDRAEKAWKIWELKSNAWSKAFSEASIPKSFLKGRLGLFPCWIKVLKIPQWFINIPLAMPVLLLPKSLWKWYLSFLELSRRNSINI